MDLFWSQSHSDLYRWWITSPSSMEDLPPLEVFQPLKLNLVADDENAAQSIIRRIWFTNDPVKTEQISSNIFLFSFRTTTNRNRVWNKRPWSIKKSHLILREWQPYLALDSIDFNLSTYWVQIHGLSLQFMTKENAIKIGAFFPKTIDCETSSRINLVGKKYIQMQIELDLRKPIPSGFLHKLGNRGVWI